MSEFKVEDSPLLVDGSTVTQPVSGTITVANPGLTDTELRATPIDVNATFTPSGTQDVNIVSTISLPVTGTFFQATQPVSIAASVAVTGPLTDTQLRATPVPVSTSPSVVNTASITRVATSTSDTVILAANANRKGFIIATETGTSNYVALGAVATTTNYTYFISSNTTIDKSNFPYTGTIHFIRSSGSGNIQVTELS